MVDGKLIANPTYEESKAAKINIVVAGTEEGIVMVESGAQQATEAEVLAAIEFGHECCKKIATGHSGTGRKVRQEEDGICAAADQSAAVRPDRQDRQRRPQGRPEHPEVREAGKLRPLVAECKNKVIDPLPEEQKAEAKKLFDALKERIFRDEMLKERRRPDGRYFDQVRKIDVEVGVLPRTHGSSLFTRGETQALVTCTLGTKDDEQRIELLDSSETSKRFMLHYNFPPFSVGEVGFMRGAGRREIGHGALAERAIAAVVPDDKAFPYTMRIVSDILESNGSSSMASVCGATLSLMDAGVPICAPVAGIAMGLVKEGDITPSSPTSPARKITTAIWTSRSPAPRPGSRRFRWTSRCRTSPMPS